MGKFRCIEFTIKLNELICQSVGIVKKNLFHQCLVFVPEIAQNPIRKDRFCIKILNKNFKFTDFQFSFFVPRKGDNKVPVFVPKRA